MTPSRPHKQRWTAWLRAARPLAYPNLAAPLLCGQALAWEAHGAFAAGGLFAALAYGACNQLYIVFLNDYADRRADALNARPTFFSGGSRVLPLGLLPPGALLRAGLAAGAAALALAALYGAAGHDPAAPLLALAGLGLLWAYSFPPARLNYRGGGEALQGLGCGAVLPLLGFYFQAGTLEGFPWALPPVLAALNTVGSIGTSLPDAEADRRAGKKTWAALRGTRAAGCAALLLGGAGLGLSWASAVAGPAAHWPDAAAALALCAGLVACRDSGKPRDGAATRDAVPGLLLATVPQVYAAAYGRLWFN